MLFDDFNMAIGTLRRGAVAGVVIDSMTGPAHVDRHPAELAVGPRDLGLDLLGLAFRKGSQLKHRFNLAIDTMGRDGTLRRLRRRYWPAPPLDRRPKHRGAGPPSDLR